MKQLLDGRVNRTIGKQDVQVIRNHMNIVMRCHFKLRGEQQFGEFVERLKEFVENLLKMCSEVQAQVNRKPLERAKSLKLGSQRIEKAILKQLSNSDNPDDLKSISRVYGQEVEDRKRAGQRYQGYELIKEVVDFKARVQHLARKRVEETAKRRVSRRSNAFLLSTRFLDVNDFRYNTPAWDPQSSTLTLATVEKLNALRYVVSIVRQQFNSRLLILLGRNGNRMRTLTVERTVTTRAIYLSSLIFSVSQIDHQHSKSCRAWEYSETRRVHALGSHLNPLLTSETSISNQREGLG